MYVLEITPQSCAKVFEEFGKPTTNTCLLEEQPQNISLVVFTGGHDVSPQLYGENIGRYTHFSAERDAYEGKFFNLAQKYKIPCVGICRGSQFLCVKSGGKLVQDICNHAGNMHNMRTIDGRLMKVNSSHHQMQLPSGDAIVLGWAEPRLSPVYLDGNNDSIKIEKECEVVYYPNINSIGIQFHPEWLADDRECVKYSKEIVRKYLF